jgi:hypothetical protein
MFRGEQFAQLGLKIELRPIWSGDGDRELDQRHGRSPEGGAGLGGIKDRDLAVVGSRRQRLEGNAEPDRPGWFHRMRFLR